MKLVRPKRTKPVVYLGSGYHFPVSQFSEEQIELLKDSLTFDNPAYETAKKYSPYSRVAIDPMISYYSSEKVNGIRQLCVPVGTDLSSLGDYYIEDCRTAVKSKAVPKFLLQLREDQQAAADTYLESNSGKRVCGAIQLPTGKGKTILALYLAATLGYKTLVIVHKDDLVTGWQKDIALAYDRCVPGLIKAKKRVVGDFITIATIQTLSKMDEEEQSKYLSAFGFVILDEMHHCPASSFSIVSCFTSKYRLGLTATAERKDGLAHVMGLYFGNFCYRYKATGDEKDILPVTVIKRDCDLYMVPVCERIDKKWVVKDIRTDPRKYKLQEGEQFITDINYKSRPRIPFGDYSDIVTRRIKNAVIEDIIKEYTNGRSCLVFLSQKQQVEYFAQALIEEYNIPREHVLLYYGNNTARENDRVLEEAEKHRQRITIATYSKATEGTNVKRWEVAFLVSSINDGKNVEQAVGRIRRVLVGKIACAVVYDYRCPHVYVLSSHIQTRDARYRKLGFTFAQDSSPATIVNRFTRHQNKRQNLFTRGYNTR